MEGWAYLSSVVFFMLASPASDSPEGSDQPAERTTGEGEEEEEEEEEKETRAMVTNDRIIAPDATAADIDIPRCRFPVIFAWWYLPLLVFPLGDVTMMTRSFSCMGTDN